jgi:hypothetical protein
MLSIKILDPKYLILKAHCESPVCLAKFKRLRENVDEE